MGRGAAANDRVEADVGQLVGHPVGSLVDPFRTRPTPLPFGSGQPFDCQPQPLAHRGIVGRFRSRLCPNLYRWLKHADAEVDEPKQHGDDTVHGGGAWRIREGFVNGFSGRQRPRLHFSHLP